ncbi:hypothetical protein P700755_001214 [Psychroflexus torquis ATCC 700755]|uniref:Secreted protein n=1 Tax=Psychroflexus torquis (strain ATCC 700755 / CIP 106069 / ACAM 623) TaxID=313595 RepID=K4IC20_PSYTT|nr:hypothetical protein [Psychroflexus torquis]AFU68152.1 hypothetical protein P700755_001214 [Psychroflexus torquis ATCC 700755]
MKKILLLLVNIFILNSINAQEFNKNIDKDSLFQVIIKDVHPDKVQELKTAYSEGNEISKEFLLMMYSLPKSSKSELIGNLEKNEQKLVSLPSRFSHLISDSLIVSIEFVLESHILTMPAAIDLKIYKKTTDGKSKLISKGRNLEYGSDSLNEKLKILNWKNSTLLKVKTMLEEVNCISIENSEITIIGFARSGLGQYSYALYKEKSEEYMKREFEQGCNYIHFKDNIALNYKGGAIGPICFPDPK